MRGSAIGVVGDDAAHVALYSHSRKLCRRYGSKSRRSGFVGALRSLLAGRIDITGVCRKYFKRGRNSPSCLIEE